MSHGISRFLPAALVISVCGILPPASSLADDARSPAEELLRLVPPDSAAVLSVDGLRDHARKFLDSRLAANLCKLPTVQAWFESDQYHSFKMARAAIEHALNVNLTDIRDDVLGDAVALAIELPAQPGNDPANGPRGLVLVKPRDGELAGRLLDLINKSQQESGELDHLADRQHHGVTYHARIFPDGSGRPVEWFVRLADGTVAFSNAESLIQSVIDRRKLAEKSGPEIGRGLAESPRWRSVASRLPAGAAVRLYIDPRQVERVLAASPKPNNPAEVQLPALIGRYLATTDYAGAALVWDDRVMTLHAVESLLAKTAANPEHAAAPAAAPPPVPAIPTTALAVVSARMSARALYESLSLVLPEPGRARLEKFETVLTGILLGQSFREEILPRLGPGLLGYIDAPDLEGTRENEKLPLAKVPMTIIVELGKNPTPGGIAPAVAIENALRTVLTLLALDEKRADGNSRVVTRQVAGTTITTLEPPIPFAYAVEKGGKLIVATTASAVARYLEMASVPAASDGGTGRFQKLREIAFPTAESYFCLDIDACVRYLSTDRQAFSARLSRKRQRPLTEVQADLDKLIGFASLFDAAFVTNRIDADARFVEQSAGLVLHERPVH
jgi:hypothetical protein